MTFIEFARQRWGPHWGLCRNTPSNRSRYDRCVSNKEYQAAMAAFKREHTAEALRDPLTGFGGNLTADLFEALEGLVNRLDSHFGGQDPSKDWKEQEQARAAISKARGQ